LGEAMNKIIAVIGMCGSGKSEAVKFFEQNGYEKVYFGGVVMDEMKSKGMDINEKNERETREQLRAEFGMGAMAVKSLDKINELYEKGNVVIESLYSWEEFKIVKQKFGDAFKLLCVYTTKNIRYKRLGERPFRPLSRIEAESRDIAEIENLDKGGPIAFADYLVLNNASMNKMKEELKKIIKMP
jgi:dephospho-CoA kinase